MESWLQQVSDAVLSQDISKLRSSFPFPRLNFQLVPQLQDASFVKLTQIVANRTAATSRILASRLAQEDLKDFAKLVEAYVELVRNFQDSVDSLPQVFQALYEMALGFNYAFDAPWLVPLAKYFYTAFVQLAFQMDRLCASRNLPQTYVKNACVPLDAIRGKMLDRQPFPATRKSGILFTANLIFKSYMKLNNLSQLQKVLDYVFVHVFQNDLSAIDLHFPKSDRCTFYFYVGKFYLLQHKVIEAESYLTRSLTLCHTLHVKNKRIIFAHVLCARMVLGRFPARVDARYPGVEFPLLKQYGLSEIFTPLILAIQLGMYGLFVESLDGTYSDYFKKLHIYNALKWRCCLPLYRNLVKRVFIVASAIPGSFTSGYTAQSRLLGPGSTSDLNSMMMDSTADTNTRPHRIGFQDVATAFRLVQHPDFSVVATSQEAKEQEYVELIRMGWKSGDADSSMRVLGTLSRLIEAGFIKGTMLPASACVVVSKKQPFPSLNATIVKLIEREMWWIPRAGTRQIVEEQDDD